MPRKQKPKPPRRQTDKQLRRFVFEHVATGEYQAPVLIEYMDAYVTWLKTGTPPGKPKLRVVASNEGAGQ